MFWRLIGGRRSRTSSRTDECRRSYPRGQDKQKCRFFRANERKSAQMCANDTVPPVKVGPQVDPGEVCRLE